MSFQHLIKNTVNYLSHLYDLTQQALRHSDPEALALIEGEKKMRARTIPLVASENYMSAAVAMAAGAPDLGARNMESNEPGVAFYQGEEFAQKAQKLAIDRATQLFGCNFANVQPFSGSTANFAIGKAIAAKLGRPPRIMSLSMAEGGHFTHGSDGNALKEIAGEVIPYVVEDEFGATEKIRKQYPLYAGSIPPHGIDEMITGHMHTLDYDAIDRKAAERRPDVIIVGGSAYPREIDFKRMKEIAHRNGALLWADISHYSGLIAGGEYPSPLQHHADGTPDSEHSADIVMTTTHKSLRGPRGGLILWNDPELSKFINEAVFPGVQGEPHPGQMLGKAVAFKEAMTPQFKEYAKQVKLNAQTLAKVLLKEGFKLITGGTDSHMVNIDLRPLGISGKQAAEALERVGLITNKMPIPGDTNPDYSGVRIGTPAATTLGLDEDNFEEIGGMVSRVLKGLAHDPDHPEKNGKVEEAVKERVEQLCKLLRFEEMVGLSASPTTRRY